MHLSEQDALESSVISEHPAHAWAQSTCSASAPAPLRVARVSLVSVRHCSYLAHRLEPHLWYCLPTQAAFIQDSVCALFKHTHFSPKQISVCSRVRNSLSRFQKIYRKCTTVLWLYNIPLRKPTLLFSTHINFLPYKYRKYKLIKKNKAT